MTEILLGMYAMDMRVSDALLRHKARRGNDFQRIEDKLVKFTKEMPILGMDAFLELLEDDRHTMNRRIALFGLRSKEFSGKDLYEIRTIAEQLYGAARTPNSRYGVQRIWFRGLLSRCICDRMGVFDKVPVSQYTLQCSDDTEDGGCKQCSISNLMMLMKFVCALHLGRIPGIRPIPVEKLYAEHVLTGAGISGTLTIDDRSARGKRVSYEELPPGTKKMFTITRGTFDNFLYWSLPDRYRVGIDVPQVMDPPANERTDRLRHRMVWLCSPQLAIIHSEQREREKIIHEYTRRFVAILSTIGYTLRTTVLSLLRGGNVVPVAPAPKKRIEPEKDEVLESFRRATKEAEEGKKMQTKQIRPPRPVILQDEEEGPEEPRKKPEEPKKPPKKPRKPKKDPSERSFASLLHSACVGISTAGGLILPPGFVPSTDGASNPLHIPEMLLFDGVAYLPTMALFGVSLGDLYPRCLEVDQRIAGSMSFGEICFSLVREHVGYIPVPSFPISKLSAFTMLIGALPAEKHKKGPAICHAKGCTHLADIALEGLGFCFRHARVASIFHARHCLETDKCHFCAPVPNPRYASSWARIVNAVLICEDFDEQGAKNHALAISNEAYNKLFSMMAGRDIVAVTEPDTVTMGASIVHHRICHPNGSRGTNGEKVEGYRGVVGLVNNKPRVNVDTDGLTAARRAIAAMDRTNYVGGVAPLACVTHVIGSYAKSIGVNPFEGWMGTPQ